MAPNPKAKSTALMHQVRRRLTTAFTAQTRPTEAWSFLPVLSLASDEPRHLVSIHHNATASRALIDLVKHRTGSLLITDHDGKTAGILTERDVLDKLPLTVSEHVRPPSPSGSLSARAHLVASLRVPRTLYTGCDSLPLDRLHLIRMINPPPPQSQRRPAPRARPAPARL